MRMKLVARNRLNVLLSCTLGGFEPILLRIRARQDHASVEQRLNPQPRQATRLLNHRATQGAIKNLLNHSLISASIQYSSIIVIILQ